MRAPFGAAVIVATTVPVRRPVGMPVPAPRRAVGVLVLVTAFVAVLVTSRLLAAGLTGAAGSAQIPAPPPVGSCVLLTAVGLDVVSCAEPHSGEVAASWPAGTMPSATAFTLQTTPHFSVVRTLSTDGDAVCAGWVRDYVGWTDYVRDHPDDLWLAPQPLTNGRLVTAPAGQGLPDRHWSACIAQTSATRYDGTVRNATAAVDPTRPAEASVCLAVSATKVEFPACSRPHNAELLGSLSLTQQMMFERSVTIGRTEPEVHRLCVQLAAQRIGRADPTFGGRLEIITESIWAQSLGTGRPASSSSWLIPDCLIRLVEPGQLTSSVVGLGELPLPLDR